MIRINVLTTDHTATALACASISADAADIERLPKSVRFSRTTGRAYIEFMSNGANGGVNETGIKRMKTLLRSAEKLGIGVVFDQPARIQDKLNIALWGAGCRTITRSELEALIAA